MASHRRPPLESRWLHSRRFYLSKGSNLSRKHYGLINFAFDSILCLLTGGLWLIWIFVREMRSR